MKYKLISKTTGEEHICDKVTVDGFDYYYIDELIPYNPNGGTNGNFICLAEIKSNKDYGVKLGDKQYISPFVKNVGQCGGCRKLIATNNSNMDLPKVVDEVEELAEKTWGKSLATKGHRIGFIEGYNKSQETHPFSEEDLISFAHFYFKEEFNSTMQDCKSSEEIFQLWNEQQPKIIYYE
jgi:hypothetical protein